MSRNARAEVLLVVPLRLRHRQQALDHLLVSAAQRVLRRVFVLDDVRALELSRAVHRNETAADVTQTRDRFSDDEEDRLAYATRLRAELREQLADEFSVMPLLVFDDANALALRDVAHAVPVPAIRITGRELARIRAAQLPDQLPCHPERSRGISLHASIMIRRTWSTTLHSSFPGRAASTPAWEKTSPKNIPPRAASSTRSTPRSATRSRSSASKVPKISSN